MFFCYFLSASACRSSSSQAMPNFLPLFLHSLLLIYSHRFPSIFLPHKTTTFSFLLSFLTTAAFSILFPSSKNHTKRDAKKSTKRGRKQRGQKIAEKEQKRSLAFLDKQRPSQKKDYQPFLIEYSKSEAGGGRKRKRGPPFFHHLSIFSRASIFHPSFHSFSDINDLPHFPPSSILLPAIFPASSQSSYLPQKATVIFLFLF